MSKWYAELIGLEPFYTVIQRPCQRCIILISQFRRPRIAYPILCFLQTAVGLNTLNLMTCGAALVNNGATFQSEQLQRIVRENNVRLLPSQ